MAFFRQIPSTSGERFAYLLADMDKREAVIIDPAEDQTLLYLSLLAEIQVRLVRILVCHSHGPDLPGVEKLRQRTGAPVSASAETPVAILPTSSRDKAASVPDPE